jgi:hypothetical protein
MLFAFGVVGTSKNHPGPDDDRTSAFATAAKPLLIWDSLVEFAQADGQSSTEMREFI